MPDVPRARTGKLDRSSVARRFEAERADASGVEHDPATPDRGPRIRREFLAGLAGLALVPAGGYGTVLACFFAFFGGIEPGTYLGPENGREQAELLLVGFGAAAMAGLTISAGIALLWAFRRRWPSRRARLVAPGLTVTLAIAAALLASAWS